MHRFADRADAGRLLGERLAALRGTDAVVLGLPRGGVVVASEVASAIHAPLDVILVRKVGVPSQPELAMGAVGEGGVCVVDDAIVRRARVTEAQLAGARRAAEERLGELASRLRRGGVGEPLEGRTAVVVDDGIATGATATAACRVARARGAARVVLAVPVIAPSTLARIRESVDEVVWLDSSEPFHGVGQFYSDFSQTTDVEVAELLARARAGSAPGASPRTDAPPLAPCDKNLRVRFDSLKLRGHLCVPQAASGIVLVAHGSGSSRRSPRNLAVAATLARSGVGTLVFDLLTPREQRDRSNVFNTLLLADRLRSATRWVRGELGDDSLAIGYFGASTGAAAALVAAADPCTSVSAVVSRGGRVDLAGQSLPAVRAPTLLIVGGDDHPTLELNRRAMASLTCEHRLEIVPGATHLFEEPGALDAVGALAAAWFREHLAPIARAA